MPEEKKITAPAATAKLMTPEQRKARYAEMRSRLGRSKIKVVAPEGVTPFWGLKDNPYERARIDWLGFKLVKEDMSPNAKRRFEAAGLQADGTYVLGDVTLFEIDTETFEMQKQIELDDFDALRSNIAEEFKAQGMKNDVPVFEVDEKTQSKVFATK